MKKYYPDYDRVFISKDIPGTGWHAMISRGDYASLPLPMIAEEFSDEEMERIAEGIAANMVMEYGPNELNLLEWYRTENIAGMTDSQIDKVNRMCEQEFEFFENFASLMGMRYWEELYEYERNEIEKAIEQAKKE